MSAILVPGNKGAWEDVRGTVNRLSRGWGGYFSAPYDDGLDRRIEAHLYDRVRNLLARRRKLLARGSRLIRMDAVSGAPGVLRPRMCRKAGDTS